MLQLYSTDIKVQQMFPQLAQNETENLQDLQLIAMNKSTGAQTTCVPEVLEYFSKFFNEITGSAPFQPLVMVILHVILHCYTSSYKLCCLVAFLRYFWDLFFCFYLDRTAEGTSGKRDREWVGHAAKGHRLESNPWQLQTTNSLSTRDATTAPHSLYF